MKETKQSKAVVRGAAFLGLLVLAAAGPGCASMQNESDSTREMGKYIEQDRAMQSGGVSNYYDPETDRRDDRRAGLSHEELGKHVDQETALRMGGVGGYISPEMDRDSDQRAGLADVDEDVDTDFSDEEAYDYSE